MGQKVSPNGLRFGINKQWVSRWNASSDKQTAQWLVEDERVRLYFATKYKNAGVEKVEIERLINSKGQQQFFAYVYAVQVGILLGKAKTLDEIERDLRRIVGRKTEIKVTIKAVNNPATSAQLIAREIADGIENRISFRSAQKKGIKKAMMGGAKGIKTKVSGRLGGAEIARDEGYSEGVVPLSTLRADIDYAFAIAKTTYGVIGVKVWINRGLYFGKGFMPEPAAPVRTNSGFNRNNRNDRRRRPDQRPRSQTEKPTSAPAAEKSE
ncbi:small subunit ribosomal protein S3 [Mycoplasmoides fastidiosum]|uniref:Small ribosomal subunit protein uS3 n=1 Tax=Mycoplasmoides fastidiosum TaxID=92758 RepID=A0ABU0LYE9_9BACT|nr:small subunit ribosomal protein S3 [Mycoplasmoides fastidiosum]